MGVEVDTLLGVTKCAMAEVCGVELGVAPLRPPNFHTVERQVKYVPYGEQVGSLLPPAGHVLEPLKHLFIQCRITRTSGLVLFRRTGMP